MCGKYVKNTEVKLLERDKKLTHFSKKLKDVTTEKDQLQHEMMGLSAKNDVLIQKSKADKAYAEEQLAKTKAKLQELKTTLKPKNVKQCEETKLKQISTLKESIVKVTEECYVRQCLASSTYIYSIVRKGLVVYKYYIQYV